MRSIRVVIFAIALLAPVGTMGQTQAELQDFPLGVTTMTWELRGEEMLRPQVLRLVVDREGDLFHVGLIVEMEGTAAELGTLGFLGSTAFIQAMGANVDLSAISTLLRRREMLEIGEEYVLPGGVRLYVRERAAVAGVECLIGEYRTAGQELVEIALSLSDPVYFMPLLRVTTAGRVTFEMVLVEYSRP